MIKRMLFLFYILSIALAQTATTEKLYLDINSDITNFLPGRNPAYLSPNTTPYAYTFTYNNFSSGGDYRLPFDAGSKAYQDISVTAYKEMQNEIMFVGRFAYRYEQRKDKMWLHNAENDLNIPFYFADSSIGDFTLNGIDWNILISLPLTRNIRTAVDIFYNVDEQFKSVFPKPNIKRNNIHIRPALAISNERSQLGIVASFFQYKEDMNTRRYSLEQGRTPIFMRIRGLDKPLLTYAETSEERLQTIRGYGVSGNINLSEHLLFESHYESSYAGILDGGSYPVPQGSWDMARFSYRVDLQPSITPNLDVDLFFQHRSENVEGFHPVLENRIYGYLSRHFEGGLTLPYYTGSGEMWAGTVSCSFQDIKREDNFLGLLHYFPGNTLHFGMHYTLEQNNVSYKLQLGYDNIIVGDEIIYDDMAAWYYSQITEREIAYYVQDREQLSASGKIVFPFRQYQIQLSGSYTAIIPKYLETRYHLVQTSIAFIF
ncbi:MAG: hypothetical protein U9O95_01610 [Candidatus Marinimicrobia bacterium]|nr:hypothetical protein [Candidatus Neomarinimicrobiota bacterium]